MIDAIDRALYWAGFWGGLALYLAFVGGLAVFSGHLFVSGLPIVWDGSSDMWTELYVGHLVILSIAAMIWIVRSHIEQWNQRSTDQRSKEKRAADQAYNTLSLVILLVLGTGLYGFLPTSGQSAEVPLWLAVVLTILGGIGIYFLSRLGRLTGLDGGGGVDAKN